MLLQADDPVGQLILCDAQASRMRFKMGLGVLTKRDRREQRQAILERMFGGWRALPKAYLRIEDNRIRLIFGESWDRIEARLAMGHIRQLSVWGGIDQPVVQEVLRSLASSSALSLLHRLELRIMGEDGDPARATRFLSALSGVGLSARSLFMSGPKTVPSAEEVRCAALINGLPQLKELKLERCALPLKGMDSRTLEVATLGAPGAYEANVRALILGAPNLASLTVVSSDPRWPRILLEAPKPALRSVCWLLQSPASLEGLVDTPLWRQLSRLELLCGSLDSATFSALRSLMKAVPEAGKVVHLAGLPRAFTPEQASQLKQEFHPRLRIRKTLSQIETRLLYALR